MSNETYENNNKEHLVLLTHGGLCHADEILALSLILAQESAWYKLVSIYRTGPNPPSSIDKTKCDVWIVDCGMEYDPSQKKFDHHGVTEKDCAFSQIAKYYGFHDTFSKYLPWYNRVVLSDNMGLSKWLRGVQCENFKTSTVVSFNNPFESFIRRQFGSVIVINNVDKNVHLYDMLLELGKFIISTNKSRQEEDHIVQKNFKHIGRVGYIFSNKMITSLINEGKQRKLSLIVTNDLSGRQENKNSMCILSLNSGVYNLHRLNCSNIGRVIFTHQQGHMCIVRPSTEVNELLLKGTAVTLNKLLDEYDRNITKS